MQSYCSAAIRRAGIAASAVACTLGLLIGPANAADLVIGVFVPTTGVLAPLGNDQKNGFELAAKGATVKGMPVRLVVEDDAASPATGLRKAQKLVLEDKAKLLIGGTSSAVTLAINAQASRLNVPIIATVSQAVAVTGAQCSRFMFRTVPHDGNGAKATAAMMQARPDLIKRKWFVVYHDYAYGHSNKAEFAKIKGVNIVGEAGRPLGTADWSSAIAQIQASGADGIYLALAVGDDLVALINQARSYGLRYPIMTPTGIPDTMLQALGDNAIGMVGAAVTNAWLREAESPQMAEFVKAYHAAYGIVPGYIASDAYASMKHALAALEAAKELDTDNIIASLETTAIDTVAGEIKFRASDHQAPRGTYISEVVKLPRPKYGATVAWKPQSYLSWDKIDVPPSESGCKGL